LVRGIAPVHTSYSAEYGSREANSFSQNFKNVYKPLVF